MIESFNFEYKKTKMFQDIQPAGLSVYGERGVEGKDGLSGSTVYFINYSTISDDLKNTLLTRINESSDLNGSGETRIYHNNDLIICEISESIYNYIYRIIKTSSKSNQFNIEKLGYITSKNNIVNIFDSIYSLKLNKKEYSSTDCHVPVNRSFEYSNSENLTYINGLGNEYASDGVSDYSSALRLLFGFYIRPEIKITDKSNADNYDFYLKIHIKNRKTILGRNNLPILKGYSDTWKSNINEEPYTDDNNIGNVLFEKVIEIPVSKIYYSGSIDHTIKAYKSYFISDMSCDKLHPSINNYSSSFFDPLRCQGYITNAMDRNFYPFHLSIFEFHKERNNYICVGKNITQTSLNSDIIDEIINVSNTYYASSFNSASSIIQYSKNPNVTSEYGECEVHFRSGESAYFSGMIYSDHFPSNCFNTNVGSYTKNISSLARVTFDQYIAAQRSLNHNLINETGETDPTFCTNRINIVKNYVCEEMDKFIFNDNNVFELICIDNRTGRTRSKIFPLTQLL